jgi:hypothetical protein
MNEGGPFKFKIGDRVTVTYESGTVTHGRILARTIEPALGKTYQVRDRKGRNLGYLPEALLS